RRRLASRSAILAGRQQQLLLTCPSVRHMVDVLAVRCREPSWARSTVASLARFAALTGQSDLEALLAEARQDIRVAEEGLLRLARRLVSYTDSQVAALAVGPKIWFRLNGVPVAWRPLPTSSAPPSAGIDLDAEGMTRAVLLALIGSGLRRSELLRVRLGDLGCLDEHAQLIPDLEAEPLAVQYTASAGHCVQYVTFLTFQARRALGTYLAGRGGAGVSDGSPPRRGGVRSRAGQTAVHLGTRERGLDRGGWRRRA